MSRIVVLTFLASVYQALQAGLAVALGTSAVAVNAGVVLVAYVALVEPPIVAVLSASMIGLVVDGLSGTPLGLNMLALLLALLLGRLAARSVKVPRGLPAFLFTAGLAAGYHLFVGFLFAAFGFHRAEAALQGFVSTSLWNGCLALLIFPFTQWILVRLKLEEVEETFSQRLARRR